MGRLGCYASDLLLGCYSWYTIGERNCKSRATRKAAAYVRDVLRTIFACSYVLLVFDPVSLLLYE